MEHEAEYVGILIDSLKKKKQMLLSIVEYTDAQEKLIAEDKLELEEFSTLVEKKGECIETISSLDTGFQKIYDRVKVAFEKEPGKYSSQIAEMKQLIPEIMQLSVSIQSREEKNKAAIVAHFSKLKKDIYKVKNTQKIAQSYYNTMNKINFVDPQFLDKRK